MILIEQVNRLFSCDALLLIPIIAVIYHIVLIKEKEWKCILVFHIAGTLNFLLEIAMMVNGTRFVESNDLFTIFLTLFALSWIDIGFFCSLAYININKVFKNSEINIVSVLILNLLFFIALPLASFNYGIFNTTVLTGRYVSDPIVQQVMQVLVIGIMGVILFLTGYRKLIGIALLNGFIFGITFQTRLYLAGIRQASIMSPSTLIIDSLTLATMPIIAGVFLMIIFRRVNFIIFGDKPPLPKSVMNLRITLTAAKVLIEKLGLKVTFSLVKELASEKKKGEPWKDLPAPESKKDIDSRNLIGDAIIIYRALLKRMDKEKAEKIIKETICRSAIIQLYSLVPIIDQKMIEGTSKEEVEILLTEIVEKFPNTDWEMIKATEKSFAYRIHRCRLVELVKQVGHPELGGAFCPGDKIYFEKFQTDIVFTRPTTIGWGQECCDFIFKVK